MDSKVSILISCHKPFETVVNDYIKPIQVGTHFTDQRFKDMLYDNDGNNISAKNKRYCELTAMYYAWKNIDSDYYGFFHYRRYLNLSDKKLPHWLFREPEIDKIDCNTQKKLGLDTENIDKLTAEYDLIMPHKFITGPVYCQYKHSKGHYIRDLDFCLDIIKKDYPEIYPYAKRYMKKWSAYLCNMFIMKREYYKEYSEFLFDVLAKHEKEFDCRGYDTYAYRVSGFLAERLTGIYFTYLMKEKKVRYTHVQLVHIKNCKVKDN